MNVRSEIDLFGLVKIRRARGPGWVVGEPYPHVRKGEQLVRPQYIAKGRDAVLAGLERARDLAVGLGVADDVDDALGGLSTAYVEELGTLLDRFPEALAFERGRRGIPRSKLAERVGVAYETIRRIEKRISNPSVDLLRRIARAMTEVRTW